ncbi:MAG: hypothetical protein OEY01_11840 [Desulfobulbaceae bacterium]|nr:hypothetical protein [Desulfobulbaceae bacterium]HIJ79497.1 hypothetical protein [Deltaproteobacteria bacterium]
MSGVQQKKQLLGEESAEIKRRVMPAIDDFVALQQEHAALIENGRLQDVFSWRAKREKVFQTLFCQFEYINDNSARFEPEFLAQLQAGLKEMLDGEALLRRLVAMQQDVMKEKMQSMRRGKKALSGYSVSNGLAPGPKFHSSRM